MRIRPIQPDELPVFAGAATHSEHVGAVHDYVFDLLIKGSMRTEWCYVAESRGRAIGRAAFWTLPKMSRPLDVVLLDVPWETEGAYEIGVNLLQEVFRIARLFGVDELGHVMDSPGQWPQWQFHEGERAALLESQGFRVDRVMHRFEFHTGEAKLPPFDERELLFRDLVQSLNLGPIWQASDSLSPRAPGSARRPFLKFAPEPRRQDYQLPAHRKGLELHGAPLSSTCRDFEWRLDFPRGSAREVT